MKRLAFAIAASWCWAVSLPVSAQFITPPAGMVVEGVPPIEVALAEKVAVYTLFNASTLVGWHPEKSAVLVKRRNGNSQPLHLVARPGETPQVLGEADEAILALKKQSTRGDAVLAARNSAAFRRLTLRSRNGKSAAYSTPHMAQDGSTIWAISNRDSTVRRLVQIHVKTGKESVMVGHLNVDVEAFAVSQVARRIAFLTRENGASVLRFLDLDSKQELPRPALLPGNISNLHWQHEVHDRAGMAPSDDTLAFNLSSAKSPSDVFTYQIKSTKLTRWTNGAASGLSPLDFVEPQRIEWKTAESKTTPGYFYQPDATTFPGKRPVIIEVRGGTPVFLGRNNYFVNAVGVAFVRVDNNTNVDVVLKWIATEPALDAGRVAVMEGGNMVLASSPLTTRPALKVRADGLGPDTKSHEDFLFYAQVKFVEVELLR